MSSVQHFSKVDTYSSHSYIKEALPKKLPNELGIIICEYLPEQWLKIPLRISFVARQIKRIKDLAKREINFDQGLMKAVMAGDLENSIKQMELGAIPRISEIQFIELLRKRFYRPLSLILSQIYWLQFENQSEEEPLLAISKMILRFPIPFHQQAVTIYLQVLPSICIHLKKRFTELVRHDEKTLESINRHSLKPHCFCESTPQDQSSEFWILRQ